jgi:3-oxoacyl-[acyl-carrier-protein] synthase II
MKTYIRATANISPQQTFGQIKVPPDLLAHMGNRMNCIEPDYTKLIDSKLIRRMSRIIKMGVAAALDCLREAGLHSPDAIITGTAYGCLQDTETFLTKMIQNKEEQLSPTSFIQSTHNTVGAQIALILNCHQYNNTFVHRGFSFESALLDAIMLLQENESNSALVGGLDEITDSSHVILSRMGLYRREPVSNLDLYRSASKGTLAGEGAAFFLLTNRPSAGDRATLDGLATFYKPADSIEIEKNILSFLASHSTGIEDLDLVITGRNGDKKTDEIYNRLNDSIFKPMLSANFKHLCGEYPTATAFGLWMGVAILSSGVVPEYARYGSIQSKPIRRILIYNHYQNIHHSLFLVSSC